MAQLTEFQPNENMKAVLSAVQESGYALSVSDACKAAGISRQAYYDWFDKPAFVTWWQNQLDRWATLRLGAVIGAAVAAATSPEPQPRGSSADRKLLLERYDAGYAPKERKELSGGVAVAVSADGQITERIAALQAAYGGKPPLAEAKAIDSPKQLD